MYMVLCIIFRFVWPQSSQKYKSQGNAWHKCDQEWLWLIWHFLAVSGPCSLIFYGGSYADKWIIVTLSGYYFCLVVVITKWKLCKITLGTHLQHFVVGYPFLDVKCLHMNSSHQEVPSQFFSIYCKTSLIYYWQVFSRYVQKCMQ